MLIRIGIALCALLLCSQRVSAQDVSFPRVGRAGVGMMDGYLTLHGRAAFVFAAVDVTPPILVSAVTVAAHASTRNLFFLLPPLPSPALRRLAAPRRLRRT